MQCSYVYVVVLFLVEFSRCLEILVVRLQFRVLVLELFLLLLHRFHFILELVKKSPCINQLLFGELKRMRCNFGVFLRKFQLFFVHTVDCLQLRGQLLYLCS